MTPIANRGSTTTTNTTTADTTTDHEHKRDGQHEPDLEPINTTTPPRTPTTQPGAFSEPMPTSGPVYGASIHPGSLTREESTGVGSAREMRQDSERRRGKLLEVVDAFARLHGEAKVAAVRAEVLSRGSLSTFRMIEVTNQLRKVCANGYGA